MDLLFLFSSKDRDVPLVAWEGKLRDVICPPRFDERMKKKNAQNAIVDMENGKWGPIP